MTNSIQPARHIIYHDRWNHTVSVSVDAVEVLIVRDGTPLAQVILADADRRGIPYFGWGLTGFLIQPEEQNAKKTG